jgi:hypothetical protein
MVALIEDRQRAKSRSLLAPLAEGLPVAIRVADKGTLSRMKTLKKGQEPLLFIVPMSVFGGDRDVLLIHLQDGGATVERVEGLTLTRLWKVGLPINAAKALISELRQVFDQTTGEKETKDG